MSLADALHFWDGYWIGLLHGALLIWFLGLLFGRAREGGGRCDAERSTPNE